MTEFEQQVAEAIAHDPTRHVDGPTGDIFVNVGKLAPRVAAAIRAAAEAADLEAISSWEHSQEAALTVLRGAHNDR